MAAAYEEQPPPPAVVSVAACTWRRRVELDEDVLVLPDGCADLVWHSGGALFVAGPDRGPVRHRFAIGTELAGIRLRPGVTATVLGVPADELCDLRVALADLWGSAATRLEESLAGCRDANARDAVLVAAIEQRLRHCDRLDDTVRAAALLLARGDVQVGALSDRLGLSDRQLHRRFVGQVGYPPKVFDRVLRFRRFLDLTPQLAANHMSLATAASIAGYADQPHLTRECGRLGGGTPTSLVAQWAPAA